ncbi:MAG: NACHT domain-containing protein [Microcoleaceae cyanobacterium]
MIDQWDFSTEYTSVTERMKRAFSILEVLSPTSFPMPKTISGQTRRHQRNQLLSQVKREVKHYRMQSLHRTVLLKLAQATPPLKMRRSWDVEAKVGNRPSFRLKSGSGIMPTFDRIGGKLLILGASGSGKTTTLMGLAKVLVSRSMADPEEPMPILLHLATWTVDQPIADWIVEQTRIQYELRPEVVWQWLEELRLLPLIDGFDAVDPEHRESCLQAINEFLVGHLCPLHLVVCSETKAYHSCPSRLQLNGAVLLRLLSKRQIREYLTEAKSWDLWRNIEDDDNLIRLAKRPLFLSMMALAFEELLIASWKRLDSLDEQRRYLLNAYLRGQITQETTKTGRSQTQTPEQIRQWLTWLAKQLEAGHQEEFSPHEISPHWLQTSNQKKKYSLGVKLLIGVVWGIILLWILLGTIRGSILGILSGIGVGLLWAWATWVFSIHRQIENFVRRGILSSQGHLPWQYRQFLNTATKRLILKKVGRHYRFIHRLLQQHLSQM